MGKKQKKKERKAFRKYYKNYTPPTLDTTSSAEEQEKEFLDESEERRRFNEKLFDNLMFDEQELFGRYSESEYVESSYKEPILESFEDWTENIRREKLRKTQQEKNSATYLKKKKFDLKQKELQQFEAEERLKEELRLKKLYRKLKVEYNLGWSTIKNFTCGSKPLLKLTDLPVPSFKKLLLNKSCFEEFIFFELSEDEDNIQLKKKKLVLQEIKEFHSDKFFKFKNSFNSNDWDSVVNTINDICSILNEILNEL
ncbi:hypothetical protein HK099_006089 [Clydaea vesicula]|uniref:Uncharacterized protein n=1 Tax=Clydaea vesicula TaxID=447962 RepID=A0AAD5U2X2_9FUNG|nr:hypothetical protein HK099_006089 [Clydaea vesicula]KAJ3383625.1 hypothetical protein HDU92_004047 [Lobulomyces angularis]